MSSNSDLRRLLSHVTSNQKRCEELVHSLADGLIRIGEEESIDISRSQAIEVAKGMLPNLTRIAWPAAELPTQFEIPQLDPSDFKME